MKVVLALVCVMATVGLVALEDTPRKGEIQFKMQFRVLDATDFLDFNGDAIPAAASGEDADYTDQYAHIQLVYGWDSRIALVFETTYRNRELENRASSLSRSGAPGVYIALRQRMTPFGGDSRFMTETGVWLPAEADDEDVLPLESGDINWVLIGSYNQDFYPTAGGFEMDLGYRFRNGDPDDEIFLDSKLKLDIQRKVKAILGYHVVESQDDSKTPFSQTDYPDERGFQILRLDFEWHMTRRWTTSIGYESLLEGRNVHETSGFRLGLGWRG